MAQPSETTDDRFRELIGSRPSKPRETGRTMVIGDGLYNVGGTNYVEDMLAFAGAWIDSYKFQRAALAIQPPSLIQAKLDLFAENDVLAFPGGNFLEAAYHEGSEREYLEAVHDVGVPGVEVSSTSIDIALEEKVALVEAATDLGLDVHFEVGKKASETDGEMLSPGEMDEEVAAALDAGAETVILEMEQIDGVREAEDGDRSLEAIVDDYVGAYGTEHLMFELPLGSYYEVMESSWWFIDRIGSDVNLGNVAPAHVLPLEQQRRGLGQNAFRDRYR
ncbi:MAG: phosphosulfolactate synthase [Halanaeroarchaeum sp.]